MIRPTTHSGSFSWTPDGMPRTLTWRKGSGGEVVREHASIAYDLGALRTSESVKILQPGASGLEGVSASYAYDALDRLTSWTSPFEENAVLGRLRTNYTLDDGGNITTETHTMVSTGVQTRAITSTLASGRLGSRRTQVLPVGGLAASTSLESYTYDALGQETSREEHVEVGPPAAATSRTNAYDALGHTTKSDDTAPTNEDVDYVYDTSDRLVSRHEAGAPDNRPKQTLYFYWGTSGSLAEETDEAGRSIVRYFVTPDGEPVAQHRFDVTGGVPSGSGTWRWLLPDTSGNVATHVHDDQSVAEQAEWDPYGRPQPAGSSQDDPKLKGSTLGFQGGMTDKVTGSLMLGPRQYDPRSARFTTPDTFVAGELDLELGTDALTGNRYLFAGANPVSFFEDGHGFFDKLKSPFRALKSVARRALPALSFVPVVGTAIDVISAATGRDWLEGGRKLSGVERLARLALVGVALVPGVGLAGRAALKGAISLRRTTKLLNALDDARDALRSARAARLAVNRAVGGAAEAGLRRSVGGAAKRFETSIGRRVVDAFSRGIIYEAKAGYVRWSTRAVTQIEKDALIVSRRIGGVGGAVWHFYRSSTTGRIGADPRIFALLDKYGIRYVVHR